jgi:hypothetical protein
MLRVPIRALRCQKAPRDPLQNTAKVPALFLDAACRDRPWRIRWTAVTTPTVSTFAISECAHVLAPGGSQFGFEAHNARRGLPHQEHMGTAATLKLAIALQRSQMSIILITSATFDAPSCARGTSTGPNLKLP